MWNMEGGRKFFKRIKPEISITANSDNSGDYFPIPYSLFSLPLLRP
jgi:hypothetical protein